MTNEARVLTLIGHDPGSQNYGISVVRVKLPEIIEGTVKNSQLQELPSLSFSILYAGKLKTTFTTLKNSNLAKKEIVGFRKEIKGLVKKFKPDVQIAERYMSRRMGGVTIELVNMLLGALRVYAEADKVPLRMIPASQWKNEIKRKGIDLKEVYKTNKKAKRTAHELDAVLIAIYGAFKLMKIKPYNLKNPDKFIDAVLHKLGG